MQKQWEDDDCTMPDILYSLRLTLKKTQLKTNLHMKDINNGGCNQWKAFKLESV